jgi:ligand-binding sensor domain-containing protein
MRLFIAVGVLWTVSAFAAGPAVPSIYGAPSETSVPASVGARYALSEVINDVWVDDGGSIWVATARRLGVSRDGGSTWRSFGTENGLPGEQCVSVWADGNEVWVSIIETTEAGYNGLGVCHSADGGESWIVLGKNDGLPADGYLELAWDVLGWDGEVWVALWNGGLGRTRDDGKTWELLTPPDRDGNPATHFYSVAREGDVIWAATEITGTGDLKTGVFKSEDGGGTWTYYGYDEGLPEYMLFAALTVTDDAPPAVWVSTAPPDPYSGYGRGVATSDDGGAIWRNYTTQDGMGNDTSYAITNAGGTVFVGTLSGVSWTEDNGETWSFSFMDPDDFGSSANEVYAIFAENENRVWAGTGAGLWLSEDGAETWRKIDYRPRTKPVDLAEAIAFPNPYTPDGGPLTIRYALDRDEVVTIEIRDYAGRLVKTVVDHEKRARGDRIDEYWRGETEDGRVAANGVYVYIIRVGDEIAATGKFIISG